MEYEIDFLPVGDGEKSGDAITFRCFDNTRQFVMVIDGGTQDTGEKLAKHIRDFYQTDQVDIVVSTHPDADHSSGLSVVLEKLNVKCLWMHRPWEHTEEIQDLFENGKIKEATIKRSLREALDDARALESIAKRKGVPINEPFSDTNIGGNGLFVLGPSIDYYESLLPHFREMPEPKFDLGGVGRLATVFATSLQEKVKLIAEYWGVETLTEPAEDATSAENNSSVILYIVLNGQGFLFTGDAGVPALTAAIDHADSLGLNLSANLESIQVPHHGSRRNISPSILDRILGPKKNNEIYVKQAYVSAAPKSDKHPSKKVVNAFKRRGTQVYSTQGKGLHKHSSGIPLRTGWSTATPLPFFSQVED